MVLTVAATSDGKGSVYTGPIVPDQVVEGGEPPSPAKEAADETLAAAVTWLTAGHGCR